MAEQFCKSGQEGWFHDPGYWSGYFHTYSHFQPAGAETARRLHIFLPREYEVSTDSYPVLYMNDGHTAFFPGGAYHKSWNLGAVLTRLYLRQQIRKLIVVAVCPVNRDYEYTHAPVWERQWGGLEDYSADLAQTVKIFVDANYRTLPHSANTAIAGASHGGLAAFYSAAKYPDCFGNVIAMSPSFWVGLDSGMELSLTNYTGPFYGELQSSSLLFEAKETLRSQRLTIYLDWGLVREGGFHNQYIEERATARGREMRDLLIQQFGYREHENLFVVEDAQGQHTEESWAARMEQALPLFFGDR